MSWKSRQLGQTKNITLVGSVTTSAGNESVQVQAPTANTVGILTSNKLTEWVSIGEVWRPIGLQMITTTTTTVTAPKVTLRKNGVSAATGGVAATSAVQTAPHTEYISFTNYTFAAADAAGDKWSVLVTTTSTAGVQSYILHYALIDVAGISDAVTTL